MFSVVDPRLLANMHVFRLLKVRAEMAHMDLTSRYVYSHAALFRLVIINEILVGAIGFVSSLREKVARRPSPQLVPPRRWLTRTTQPQSGHAYRCFCSPDRLAQTRERLARAGLNSTYDKHCLSLSSEEVSRRVRAGEKNVVRLNVSRSMHACQIAHVRAVKHLGLDTPRSPIAGVGSHFWDPARCTRITSDRSCPAQIGSLPHLSSCVSRR
jgi:hypothetical protein